MKCPSSVPLLYSGWNIRPTIDSVFFFLHDKRVHAVKPQNSNRSINHPSPAEERLSVWWGSKHPLPPRAVNFQCHRNGHLLGNSPPIMQPLKAMSCSQSSECQPCVSDGPDQNTPWQNNSPCWDLCCPACSTPRARAGLVEGMNWKKVINSCHGTRCVSFTDTPRLWS